MSGGRAHEPDAVIISEQSISKVSAVNQHLLHVNIVESEQAYSRIRPIPLLNLF